MGKQSGLVPGSTVMAECQSAVCSLPPASESPRKRVAGPRPAHRDKARLCKDSWGFLYLL